ncbi:MAG: hypothetical protein ACM3US_16565 [Sphingomonadaceae bacterium]
MPSNREPVRGLVAPAVVVLLVTFALTLAGCDFIVEEARTFRGGAEPGAKPTAVADLPEYDVAVSAIDFDPPLKRETLVSTQNSVKLLAAVENRGTMPLTGLLVEARVTSQKGDFTADDRVPIDRLSPGETKVVEFEGVAPAQVLPRSTSYRVRVLVESTQSNTNLRSASREVIVRVVEDRVPQQ